MPFDVDYSAAMDLLTPEGFSNALYHMANTNPGSGSLTAPVCSTFVIVLLEWMIHLMLSLHCCFDSTHKKIKFFMLLGHLWLHMSGPSLAPMLQSRSASVYNLRSRGSTRRSPRNPLGRKDSEAVRKGNILACRAFILCFIAAAKAIWFVLEQPASSCVEHHPLFQHMARLVPLFKYSMRMGDHGGPTLKPTLLYSSFLESL